MSEEPIVPELVRPVGRPRGQVSEFARATKAFSPETIAMLKGMWCSGKFGSKEELAEHAGIEYNTLRHLASTEKWPTENELKREIGDTAVAAIRKLRETEVTNFVAESMSCYREASAILKDALVSFQAEGALVKVDGRTGELVHSKRRVQDVKQLMDAMAKHQKVFASLVDLAGIQRQANGEAKSGGTTINAPGSLLQLNHLVKQ